MEIRKFKKLLVANRGEIAIRVCRAAHEIGIRTVAIYSHEDRFALHRFKADEAYQIGKGKDPVKAYLDIDGIIHLAKDKEVDAIHPGYGFLSENANFARACEKADITFVGPRPEILDTLGNKTSAREIAEKVNVPILSGCNHPIKNLDEAKSLCSKLGYPVIIKAAHGGGGRGMRVVHSEFELGHRLNEAKRESLTAFGSDECFIEKYVEKARHIEVQILGDKYNNMVHLFERDCSLQRRHQKVVEIAPAQNLGKSIRQSICDAAVKIGKSVNYDNAGTVEFLLDTETEKYYFIEVNPRIQVEHTVTETITGFDLVKRQILISEGFPLNSPEIRIPNQEAIHINSIAFQCRITTEDPSNGFVPDYGRIQHYRSAGGMGIRLDAGTAFSGALVTPYYDSMLVKVTAFGTCFEETAHRMDRALDEFRIRGVKTNIPFLINLINHKDFLEGKCTTRFIDENPNLFHFSRRRDRATLIMRFMGDILVNGHPLIKEIPKSICRRKAPVPAADRKNPRPKGSRDLLLEMGPKKFTQYIIEEKKLLLTDTSFRDAHQSLLATRMRTIDMLMITEIYSRNHADFFSLEMWGGATFDTAMRFLMECPWERLRFMRKLAPNILFQMLLRASNGVGYTNYPDNVVKAFIKQSAESGIDIFRVFDSLNWVTNMKVAMDAVLETKALCEAAICYTGDILDSKRTKYTLGYYIKMAKELEGHGAHILAIKDMAGLLKPYAAYELVSALKSELKIPIHLHTHDTSGGQIATLIKAAEAGVDIVDAAVGPLSGLTSQPNLNTLVEMMRFHKRDTGMDFKALGLLSDYWEVVREYYAPFESIQKSSTAEVYHHEIPGGQFTNLFQQAHSMGLAHRWHEITDVYADVNQLFGDIVKVTPSSKVVGDLTLFLVTNDLRAQDIVHSNKEISFPTSVIEFFEGRLGQPTGGFPKDVQYRILRGAPAFTERPGANLPPVNLDEIKKEVGGRISKSITNEELMSYLMYPDVFIQYAEHRKKYDDVSVIPTDVFFYGLPMNEEVALDIEEGKTLIFKLVAISPVNAEGDCTVFFELNGQPREVVIANRKVAASVTRRPQAEEGNSKHVAAPMPGMIVNVKVGVGDKVVKNDPLLIMEAMKMEATIYAEHDGEIGQILVKARECVEARDLLIVYK
ncbi:MAG: pyruvate carboxylase [Candidatus Brocadia sinica]|uniref:Pyruvate carboxylase n=1 Tax=Candidatus Brocadia sinica JPN1 TaxID=1197129 RepID=A0ABQ0K339_9BACT|nr:MULTISPECIES: pyruvate carboxylase [Candidatus Brocadiaceae]MCK6469909.1 pyruvate carboxylase [Candidatus Brocadia sinica]NUO06147.1 pyruvate carboxylase [Candidatus Brocadia sinica]GAN35328.1 pyruvate carboxylase [Candidatus Brocadia sinica JPN1]GIK12323.1 MAG: pyruvate carboxylase [Candidatus Brocadia sinica]GJQ19443.1 MAG: pyruvate carboxylase [Candidatus Brocadia sinica]